jgi:hypothetical protein
VNETVALWDPTTTVPIVGGPGAPGIGETTKLAEGAEGGLEPTLFWAVTVHVYVLPLVRFRTTIGLVNSSNTPRLAPPSLDTHDPRNAVNGLPPLKPGVNATEAPPLWGVTVVMVGACGLIGSTKVLDATDGELVPIPFVAVMVHVYV